MSRPLLLPIDPAAPATEVIERAAAVLRAGGLVAFPTETVYGLGADARSPQTLRRVFAAKGRPADNPLIVHVPNLEAAEGVARLSPLAERLGRRFWPGPLTLVLEALPGLAPEATAGLRTVGVRVPDHPVALALLAAAGVPVAAPSANRSGRPSPTTARHVLDDLGAAVDVVLDGGPSAVGVESTVVDARGDVPVVLREGAVTREHLGLVADPVDEAQLAASPGTRHAHYQPRCAVEIAPVGEGPALAAAHAAVGRRVGLVAADAAPPGVIEVARAADAAALAERLYGALRTAEDRDVDLLVVEGVPEQGIGRAVMDRLRRAAART